MLLFDPTKAVLPIIPESIVPSNKVKSQTEIERQNRYTKTQIHFRSLLWLLWHRYSNKTKWSRKDILIDFDLFFYYYYIRNTTGVYDVSI